MNMHRRHWLPGLICSWLIACGGQEPALVRDDANLLSEAQIQELSLHHEFLLFDYDIDYRLVTSETWPDIDRAAAELFETVSVGGRSSRGRGLLLLLDPASRQVRLEVGYALEGTFPDAFVAYVEQRQMVPFFVQDRISDGILASTELIVDRAQRAERNASWDDEIWMQGSGGAGARTSTVSAPGYSVHPPVNAGGKIAAINRSPADVVEVYLDAMSRRDSAHDLDIYTDETRRLLQDWLVTPAQMDQISRTYARCKQDRVRFDTGGHLAVIRYPISQRQCAPWFLEKTGNGWQLDLTMQQKVVRFGRSNAWHFDRSRTHPYAFAFDDWNFDANGFPIGRRDSD